MCQHLTDCPNYDAPDREAAVVVASCPAQGFSVLCNGVLLFDDRGAILPDGRIIDPLREVAAPAGAR
ncbi:DUF5999 family protein [Streptacidiphilus sp. MAP5-52]|uniref:DUF5999 family protein n=1 Tax=Streptacidiphilus sp. MAP5-52 TaxID=3156267 RepID=UPI003511B356